MSQLETQNFDQRTFIDSDADATLQQGYGAQKEQNQEACLVQIYPPDVVDGMILLDEEGLDFGRDERSCVTLNDSSVSRRHAKITLNEDGYYIKDLGSTNGTRVNDKLVSWKRLKSGDRIQLGSFIFKYLLAGCVESQYHETVYTSMTRDELTGAMNKRYLLDSMQREIARSVRRNEPLSIIMIDVDHFKSINDTHGHLVGDEVLREFGARLLAVCREDNLLARYGGEEFSLLLPSSTKTEAIEIAEQCRGVIAEVAFDTEVGPLNITASFGIGCLEENETIGCLDLIKIADDRLYDAKHQGRNRVIA